MKKILIAGKNSYIGTSFEKYVKDNDEFIVDTIDTKTSQWKETDFSGYDSILNVAGIAHFDHRNITEEIDSLCRNVNTTLACELAKKAKASGVEQFVQLSSMSVFGEIGKLGKRTTINKATKPAPLNVYGDSKLQAEYLLKELQSDSFNIAIIRPPMVYGPNCVGNYVRLSNFAQKLPLFPQVKNERSMIYIGNLCEFIKLIVKNNDCGVFMPQNKEYVNTSEMVKAIARMHNRKIITTRIFNPALKLISPFVSSVNKAFGSLTYDHKISEYKEEYQIYEFLNTIE